MSVLSEFGRIEEQRFLGFAEEDWDAGAAVNVRATLRLFLLQQNSVPVQLPDLVARICPG